MKGLREYISLATEETIESSLKIDARVVSTRNDYANQNRLGYHLCINTWLHCIRVYSPYGWMFVSSRIGEHGLLDTIATFDRCASALVHGERPSDALANSIIRDIGRTVDALPPIDGDTGIGRNKLATALFLFRYPKRFSPVHADKLQDGSIQEFRNTENRTKLLQRREHPQVLVEGVREKVSSLNWGYFLRKWDDDLRRGIFTPGSCFETDASQLSKVEVLSHQCPEYLGTMMGTYYVPMRCDSSPVLMPKGTPRKVVRIISVPKSYKTARIVAPEELQRQMMARYAFDLIEHILPPSINLRDQTQNQDLCCKGAATGLLATIDLSRASDCISHTLVQEVFPKDVLCILDQLTPEWYTLEGRGAKSFYPLQQYSTMGNSLTFVIESILFWAIAQASVDYHRLFAPDDPLLPVSVYGDDIIVPTYAAEICMDWLRRLGFIVNDDKSFWDTDHKYRESCGVEWFEGVEVSSYYWPRKEIKGNYFKTHCNFSTDISTDTYTGEQHDATSILIELQHRLYGVCEPAAQYLACMIMEAHPKMTYSEFGTPGYDLWGPEDTSLTGWAPVTSELYDAYQGKDRPEWLCRPIRYTMSVRYEGVVNPHQEMLWDQYKYTDFLQHGPVYTSELDRLLGVSTPRPSAKQAAGKPKAVWTRRKF